MRVTCRGCGAVEVWELGALIDEVRRNGGSTDWRAARAAIKCPRRCASPRIDLLPIPFGRQRARRRVRREALVNLSLAILREAVERSAADAVGTVEVRLALHVLRPFVREDRLLVDFWRAATVEPRHPWASCHLPYRRIAQRLDELQAAAADADPPSSPPPSRSHILDR